MPPGPTLRREQFPVLDDEEAALVGELGVGLDDRAAGVLAYLLARERSDRVDDPEASKLAVRVGVGLGAAAAGAALDTLEGKGLISATAASGGSPGRPATRWRAAADASVERVHELHAADLLEQAERVADGLDVPAGNADGAIDGAPTVALNWEPNGLHAPLLLAARERDLSLVTCRGSEAALDRLTAGEADVALAGAASVLRAQARDRPVAPIALCVQRTPTALYTTREAFGTPFESVEQLRGRRLATPPGSETGTLARLLLAQADLLGGVTVVETDAEEQAALSEGRADVVTGVAADLLDLRAGGSAVDAVLVADHFPAYGPALVVREPTLRARPEALAACLEAAIGGWATVVSDPERAAAAVAARSERGPDRERRHIDLLCEEFAATDAVRDHGWGWHSVEGWRRLRTALEQADILDP